MEKVKKNNRYLVSLTDSQMEVSEQLMRVYGATSISSLYAFLLLETYKLYKTTWGKTKGKTDAPDDKNLAIYPHPRGFNIMLNRSELESYYELTGQAIPEGTFKD